MSKLSKISISDCIFGSNAVHLLVLHISFNLKCPLNGQQVHVCVSLALLRPQVLISSLRLHIDTNTTKKLKKNKKCQKQLTLLNSTVFCSERKLSEGVFLNKIKVWIKLFSYKIIIVEAGKFCSFTLYLLLHRRLAFYKHIYTCITLWKFRLPPNECHDQLE